MNERTTLLNSHDAGTILVQAKSGILNADMIRWHVILHGC